MGIKTLNAHGTLGKQPDKAVWVALSKRAQQVAPRMTVHEVLGVLEAYMHVLKSLRRKPAYELMVELQNRLEIVAPQMNPREVADALKIYSELKTSIGSRAKDTTTTTSTTTTTMLKEPTAMP